MVLLFRVVTLILLLLLIGVLEAIYAFKGDGLLGLRR